MRKAMLILLPILAISAAMILYLAFGPFKDQYQTLSITDYIPAKEYAVGWGTLALINAGLAQGKNRSGLKWFLLSILIGPLSTLILTLSNMKEKSL